MATAVANHPRPSSGETLQERSKGKDVRISNIVAAKVCFLLSIDDINTVCLWGW